MLAGTGHGEEYEMPQITFTELAVLLLLAVHTAFWVWMLVEAVTRETDTRQRTLWSVVIVLGQGLGALAYFVARRPLTAKNRT